MVSRHKNPTKPVFYAGLISVFLLTGCGTNQKEREEIEKDRRAQIQGLETELKRIKEKKEEALELDKKLGYITGKVFARGMGVYSEIATGGLSGEYKGKMGGGAIFPIGLVLGGSNGSIRGEYNSSGYTPYFVGIKTDEGRAIGLHIADAGDKKAGAVYLIIQEGSRIRFPAGNLKSIRGRSAEYYSEETCFNEDTQIGTKRADRIEVLVEE